MNDDDRYDPSAWPPWAFAASTALVAVLAIALVGVAPRPLTVAPLAALVVVPGLFHLVGKHPPVWFFLALTTLPLLALTTVAADAAGEGALLAACIALYVQGESVAAYRPSDAAAAVLAAGVVLFVHAQGSSVPPAYWFAASATAVTLGYLLRKQQHTVVALRATQDKLAGEAALRERQRIAREVHDVVAHSLTVTMMHLTAARMAVRRDPGEAVEALEEAERLGRSSLDEIRRTVAVLRSGEEQPTDRALPAADDLEGLVAGYRAAGVKVTLAIRGDLTRLDAQTGRAVYRIVQEAVANAAKHAAGEPVEVDVVVDGGAAHVRVANDLPARVGARSAARGGGMGLVGMRERIELLGGTVTAGPAGRHWVVAATVGGDTDGGWCR